MMRDYRFWLSMVGLVLAGRLIYPVIAGERSSPVRQNELQEIVYVCNETGEAFLLRATSNYEKNPHTGKPTLTPRLYCKACKKWRATPPLSVLQQNPSARLCPVHKSVMSASDNVRDSITNSQ